MQTKTIALPRLNNIRPSIDGTALKLMEETGELGSTVTRWHEAGDPSPSEHLAQIGRDLLDVAQTAITMIYVLEEQYGVDLKNALTEHIDKLLRKGYLRLDKD